MWFIEVAGDDLVCPYSFGEPAATMAGPGRPRVTRILLATDAETDDAPLKAQCYGGPSGSAVLPALFGGGAEPRPLPTGIVRDLATSEIGDPLAPCPTVTPFG